VCLLEQLAGIVGQPSNQGIFTPDQAKAARRLLIENVRFFGPKSASDFLMGLGLANSLLALDVRLLNLLIDRWGFEPSWRDRVHRLSDYERLESCVIDLFCSSLEVEPVELDRLLFYGYPNLKGSKYV
jgi:thermostable 8-oxoguanine DNA glycosylase